MEVTNQALAKPVELISASNDKKERGLSVDHGAPAGADSLQHFIARAELSNAPEGDSTKSEMGPGDTATTSDMITPIETQLDEHDERPIASKLSRIVKYIRVEYSFSC